jgi:metal-responsive CopG/Arc/MetJ family transcriptional regulator
MKRVTVSVPEEVDARVREWAEEEGKSLSRVYADAVEAYVREKRRQQAAERVEAILDRTTVESGAEEELHADRDDSDRSFPQSP